MKLCDFYDSILSKKKEINENWKLNSKIFLIHQHFLKKIKQIGFIAQLEMFLLLSGLITDNKWLKKDFSQFPKLKKSQMHLKQYFIFTA